MCRASTDERGGYRCIPRQALLETIRTIYDEKASSTTGENAREEKEGVRNDAFWLKDAPIPSLSEIIEEVSNTKKALDDENYSSLQKELFINHLGNLISVYSDNNVVDFTSRLQKLNQFFEDLETIRVNREMSPEEYRKLKQTEIKGSIQFGFEVKESLISTLRSLREFDEPLYVRGKGRYERVAATLADISTLFPSQWNLARGKNPFRFIEDSEQPDSAYFRSTSMSMYIPAKMNRAIYENRDKLGQHGLQSDENYWQNRRVLIHETCHYYETISPPLRDLQKAFRERRVQEVNSEKEKPYIAKPPLSLVGYEPDQKFHIDHFVNPYVGSDYSNPGRGFQNFEILSMGMESIMAGQEGSLIGLNGHRADPDHRNTVLGVLASVDLPKKSLLDNMTMLQ